MATIETRKLLRVQPTMTTVILFVTFGVLFNFANIISIFLLLLFITPNNSKHGYLLLRIVVSCMK